MLALAASASISVLVERETRSKNRLFESCGSETVEVEQLMTEWD